MQFSKVEINLILDIAAKVKKHPEDYSEALKGKNLALLFQKTSTRTRVSFEVGMNQLGGNSLYLDWQTTNFTLGTLEDEIRCMSGYVDAVMARVYDHSDIVSMIKGSTVPIINGLSDLFHPCQALADIQTIRELFPKNEPIKMVFIGDGANNVSNSTIVICAILGINLTVIASKEFLPVPMIQDWIKAENYEKIQSKA